MNDILNSEDFADFCENYNCDEDCPLFLYKSSNGTGYSCSSRFYKIKFEAEKAKVEKLKKCVEFYADYNNWYNQTIDQCDCEDIIREVMNFNGEPELIREASIGGILARQTLKEIGE